MEIQTRPVSAAQPGPASPPTAQPAAPHQEDAAGRRRSRRRRGPASALRSRARARAHQATLAARRQGTCQTPATRVQAAPGWNSPPLALLASIIGVSNSDQSLFKFTDVVSRRKNWPAGKMTFCMTRNAGCKGQSKHRQSNQTKQK